MNFSNRSLWLAPVEPWLYRVTESPSSLTDYLCALQRQELKSGAVRWLRGRRMRTIEDMFNEFAAALQFPYYFGGNWAAFDECLADLSWSPASAYLITILDSRELLANEDSRALALFINTLEAICAEWSTPNLGGQTWVHDSVPFHFIFQCTPEEEGGLATEISALTKIAVHQNHASPS